jgi:hypothetical protein
MGRSQVCQEHRTGPLVYLFPEVVGEGGKGRSLPGSWFGPRARRKTGGPRWKLTLTQKGKVCDLFFAGICCTDGKGQQLACLGGRFGSGVTKEQRRPQVKGDAGGSLPAGQDPDFFFDRNAHLGANRGIFALASSDGNDFAWFAHGRF